MQPHRILHLVGSPTSDFYCDLSKLYARGCLRALSGLSQYRFVIAYVTPDGYWRFPLSLSTRDIALAPPMSQTEAIQSLALQAIDAALPQMFCMAGMTHYRALLELLSIPLIGNGSLQMAIAADKNKAKTAVSAAGVPVPVGELLQRGETPFLSPPVVVKPNCSDNSDGVSLVRSSAEYAAALEIALGYAEQVLVESFIPLGREVRCGVVEQAGELICLPLEEYFVDAQLRPIRTRIHKLKRDAQDTLTLTAKEKTQAWIVDIDDPITPRVWEMARRCHRALGCRQYSLFDFRVDPTGKPWFIEAGLYCSFSPQSVLVTMMAAAGVALPEFFEQTLAQAVDRHRFADFSAKDTESRLPAVLSE